MNYFTSFRDNNIAHILRQEILPLAMLNPAELKKRKLYIVANNIDRQTAQQKWRAFVFSCVFHEVVYVCGKVRALIVRLNTRLKTDTGYQCLKFVDDPPQIEYVQFSEFIKANAGIKAPAQEYVLLNQRPVDDRYLIEVDSGLPLEQYLSCALEGRDIPFRSCDFSVMTPAAQAQICGGANILIAAHGAGLSNSILTPRHCHVLEYNFRKYWNCDPVCEAHRNGVLADHEECHGELTYHAHFHKADFHNLCRLLGRPYTELEVTRYGGRLSRNPIGRRSLFVNGASLLAEIEKQISC